MMYIYTSTGKHTVEFRALEDALLPVSMYLDRDGTICAEYYDGTRVYCRHVWEIVQKCKLADSDDCAAADNADKALCQIELDLCARSMVREAREKAHAACPDTAEEFAREYMISLAGILGNQRRMDFGSDWSPDAFILHDEIILGEHAGMLRWSLNLTPWDEMRAAYGIRG